MTVFPDLSLVFTFPARLFECLLSSQGNLLEGAVVHRRCVALPWCTPLFLRLLIIFYGVGAHGEIIICIFPRLEVGRLSSPLLDVVV